MVRCALIMDGQSLPWWWASACQYARQPAGSVPVDEGVGSNLPRAHSGAKVCIVAVLLCPGCCGQTRAGALVDDDWARGDITRCWPVHARASAGSEPSAEAHRAR